MVKNLPAVERSTKIRFGKNVPEAEAQAENTIVFNATNSQFSVPTSNAVYLSPVRNRTDYEDKQIVLLMYNRTTKEITESGEAATDIIQTSLQGATNFGNITSNVVTFTGAAPSAQGVSFTTSNIVGLSNLFPEHTVSVGSNLYVDDSGRDVLVVSGNVSILGNLQVTGDTTVINTENTSIRDAIVELGKDNTSGDTTLDLGILMHRPDALSNVVMGYREGSDEFVIAYTDSKPIDKILVPKTDEDINVHVYGLTHVDANIYAHEDVLVDGNVYVSGNTSVTEELTVSGNVYADKDLEVMGNTYVDGNVVAYKDLLVSGNVYVSQNVSVTEELTVSGTVYADKDLEVIGNVYVDGNVVTYKDLLVSGNVYVSQNVSVTEELNVSGNVYAQKDLEVVGNAYVSQNVSVTGELSVSGNVYADKDLEVIGNVVTYKDLLVSGNAYVSQNVSVTEELTVSGNVYADKDLEVVGNAYVSQNVSVTEELTVSGNVYADKDLEVVGNVYVDGNVVAYKDLSVTGNAYVSGNVNVTKQLSVSGNAYVSGNVEVTKSLIVSANTHLKGPNVFITNTLDFLNPKTAIVTDLNSNVEIKLNQLANVVIGGKALASEDMLVYDGSNWTNQLQNHTFRYGKAEEVIDKGEVVYATGTVGNNMFSIRKARSDSSTTMPALGVAYQAFTLNQEGLIVTFGRADGIDTDNFQTGETVYVSNVTAGALSNVKPYGATDLIQNIGLVVKGHPSTGIVSVTGVGRSNDIPNAPIVADEGDINYVYVNDANNDLKKILPTNLLTQLQTLQQVTDTGNTTSNTIQFTDVTTGLVTVGNVEVGGNISISDLIDPQKKYLTMVNQDGFLQKSPVYVDKDTGVYVIEAAEAEFQGNLTLSGNTTILNSESVTISDRIFGVAANNSASQLDSGFMIEHQEGDPLEYANVAIIYHADEHRFSISYTQNTFTDNHILHYEDEGHRMLIDLRGNVQIQNNTTIGETLDVTGAVTFADDLTVGAASNLFVDVSSSRVGINEASPTVSLDVGGDARVQSTTDTATKTAGALVVSGGLGVASNIHSTNVYAASHVGVGTDAATAPIHLLVSGTGETTNGIYMKSAAGSATNDAIVNLEVAADGGDAFMTWNASGGAAFAMGLDRSESLLTIANSSSDLTTNARLRMATDGAVTLTNATNATSKTTGALIVGGGIGVTGDIHATHANLEDVEADSVNVTDTTTSDSTTTGALRVAGGVSTQENLNVGGVTKVWDSTAVTGKTDGALVVVGGVGISGDIHATHANLEDVEADSVNITDTTAATGKTDGALVVTGGVVSVMFTLSASTSSTTGALKAAGGVGIAKDVYVGERAYVTGGLVTNTGGVSKKTYSFSGDLASAQTIANSTIKITFSAHVFYAKIVAHLVESDDEVSTLSMECGGGHWTGGTPLAIAKGPVSIFGSASTNPWSSTITTTTTEVSFKPTTNMAVAGHYNVFIEYISQSSSGEVTKITEGSTDVVTFGY